MRQVYINVKHLHEWWSEGKDNIEQMKHKNENGKRFAIKRWFIKEVCATISFSAMLSLMEWILFIANSTFALSHLLGEKEFWFWTFGKAIPS